MPKNEELFKDRQRMMENMERQSNRAIQEKTGEIMQGHFSHWLTLIDIHFPIRSPQTIRRTLQNNVQSQANRSSR